MTTEIIMLTNDIKLSPKDTREFEHTYLSVMKSLSALVAQRKALEADEKRFKASLERVMNERGIKSIYNDYIRITRVASSPNKIVVDLDKFEAVEPEEYQALLEDYPKVVKGRKGSIRFEVKEMKVND